MNGRSPLSVEHDVGSISGLCETVERNNDGVVVISGEACIVYILYKVKANDPAPPECRVMVQVSTVGLLLNCAYQGCTSDSDNRYDFDEYRRYAVSLSQRRKTIYVMRINIEHHKA